MKIISCLMNNVKLIVGNVFSKVLSHKIFIIKLTADFLYS